jgi:diaminohydroxyphosphoribosylaminopyrimidine deaminase/5-amino-6-(5-phosphoribosylamino)uracil reductase
MPTTLAPLPRARFAEVLTDLGERARAWRFDVAPNPCVGAAFLDARGDVIAEGFHRVWGGAHAEVDALRALAAAGVPVSEAHALVVTLEPCSSTGKTPPCTDALLRAGVRRVVVGELDPDPRHRGRGVVLLRERGLVVDHLPGPAALTRVTPHFLRWNDHERVRRPRPWLIAKWAQTRSGHLVPPPDVGEGRWISAPESLREVQLLRSHVDAIVTGVGTVKADDPRLSVRYPAELDRAPLRVVLDSELSTPPNARLFAPPEGGEAAGAVLVMSRAGANAVRHRALLAAGAEIHGLHPGDDGRVDLREVLAHLWSRGARRVLLEAGPTLTKAFFERGFVDQMRVYTGAVNGGRGESLGPLLAGFELHERLHREVGPDGVLEAFPGRRLS